MDEAREIISTVDDACSLILRWFGWQDKLLGSRTPLSPAFPKAIRIVSHRLGRMWEEPRPAGDVNLFNSQDRLIAPHHYQADADGLVPIIWENQGVWGCAVKPETGAQLWVTGDWPDAACGTAGWRPTADEIDKAIIFVLLANSVLASANCEYDDEDEKPDDADRLLWAFAPWSGFSGFWTNKEESLIRMQGYGWGVTARRP